MVLWILPTLFSPLQHAWSKPVLSFTFRKRCHDAEKLYARTFFHCKDLYIDFKQVCIANDLFFLSPAQAFIESTSSIVFGMMHLQGINSLVYMENAGVFPFEAAFHIETNDVRSKTSHTKLAFSDCNKTERSPFEACHATCVLTTRTEGPQFDVRIAINCKYFRLLNQIRASATPRVYIGSQRPVTKVFFVILKALVDIPNLPTQL